MTWVNTCSFDAKHKISVLNFKKETTCVHVWVNTCFVQKTLTCDFDTKGKGNC